MRDETSTLVDSEVTFRKLTPVYNCSIQGAVPFTHAGRCGAARFNANLHPYKHDSSNWAVITEFADDGVREMLLQQQIHFSRHFFGSASHFLLTDIIHPANSVTNVDGGTVECLAVHSAVLDSLRLHCSGGLPFHETYDFRSPPPLYSGLQIHTPNARHLQSCHLGSLSTLHSESFPSCRTTIDRLINTTRIRNVAMEKVLRLAMEYHRLAFTFERVDHAFLILMVAYEAMFKRNETENASKSALRIGRLLGATKVECKAIQKQFNDSFSKIRNEIAHGDPDLDMSTVESAYPSLYAHFTAALVAILNLPAATLDQTKDYYDEIHRYAETRFNALPQS